jgi:hypothetical protein
MGLRGKFVPSWYKPANKGQCPHHCFAVVTNQSTFVGCLCRDEGYIHPGRPVHVAANQTPATPPVSRWLLRVLHGFSSAPGARPMINESACFEIVLCV